MSLSIQRVPSSSSSSSSSTIPSTYDVFLSFRGKDTRNGFTDHLYEALKQRGFHVFRDDEKLQKGKDISHELFPAIKKSQYAVVIISKNFAFSKWCLRELTQIVECMREERLKVLPVFYHVDPSDVRKQKGTFAKAFDKHRKYFKINGRQKKSHRTEMNEVADCTVEPSDVRRQKRSFEEASNNHGDNREINRRQMKSRRTDLKESVGYAVDPSVARNQEMHFVESSAPNADNPEPDQEPMKSWRNALEEVGNLCGWHVNNSSEATVVREIATEIFCGLRLNLSEFFGNLVGVDSKVKELVSLLCLEKGDVRYIGIHGMGGVGKTTLAKVLYEIVCCEFDARCFISGTKDNKSCSIAKLQQQIVHEILKEHNERIWNDYYGIKSLAGKLKYKKVLIVLDDINQEQLNALAGNPNWFGGNSRIVITSRDRQFWKSLVSDDNTYEVKPLDSNDALQLFCWKVFNSSRPRKDFVQLSKTVTRHMGGLPLAIEVIGSSLVDKEIVVWNSICDNLETNPSAQILDKLQLSYHCLEDLQRRVFLDIACLFNGMYVAHIIPIWQSQGFSPEDLIDALRDKSLLEFSWDGHFHMHDLIQKMGQRIVSRENLEEPEKRSRLYCPNDIVHVLKNKYGTNAVKGIVFKFPSKKQKLGFKGFSNLTSLEILVIEPGYDYWREGLKKGIVWSRRYSKLMLSNKLRFLRWWGCPLPSFPRSFQLNNLVRLEMPFSHLKQLWHGRMCFEKLMYFSVESKDLIEIPDFGGAPSLKEINFSGCKSLQKVHPSIGNLSQLQCLSLRQCESLEELPKEFNLESLLSLNLFMCLRLKKLPDLSRVPHIKNIHLYYCKSLRELPPSIGNLKRLQSLSLSSCESLEELPKEINWESLKRLDLCWCSRLKKLPDLSKVPNVKEIILTGCKSLTKLHPSIGNLRRLEFLSLSNCESLKKLPTDMNCESLKRLALVECLRLKKLPDLSKVLNVETISISGSKSLKKLHPSIGNLKRLDFLSISNCENLEKLPKEMNCESLWHLNLDGCLRLKELPDLSSAPNIFEINLSNCESLRELHPSIGNLKELESLPFKFCKSLEELPEEINWEPLEELDLRGCLRLKNLPNLSGVPNIKSINLSDCESLKKLHPSIGNLQQLQCLSLSRCRSLKKISKVINCKSLEKLYLDECLRLEKFPEIGDNMTALRKVDLRGTAIKWLPLSFQKLSSLQKLLAGGSQRTEAIQPPHDMLPGRTGFCSSDYLNLRCFLVLNWLANFKSLAKLHLQYCNLSDESFPRDFSITSVRKLNLSGNKFTKIPEFLKAFPCWQLDLNLSDCSLLLGRAICNDSLSAIHSLHLNESEFTRLTDNFCLLYNLWLLSLRKCRWLQALPKLPLNLTYLDVTESPLLEMIYDQRDMETSWEASGANVCLWFSAASINGHDGTPYKIIQLQPPCPINKVKRCWVQSVVSWGPTMRFEIPEWFQQRCIGSHGKFQSRVNVDLTNWLGYALFVVYEVHEYGFPEFVCQFHLDDNAREQPLVLRVPEARSVGENGFWAFLSRDTLGYFCRLWGVGTKECGFSISSKSTAEIKECGVRAVYGSEESEFFHVLRSISPHAKGLETPDNCVFRLDDFQLHLGWQSEK